MTDDRRPVFVDAEAVPAAAEDPAAAPDDAVVLGVDPARRAVRVAAPDFVLSPGPARAGKAASPAAVGGGWDAVLWYRPEAERAAVAARFDARQVSVEALEEALVDHGTALAAYGVGTVAAALVAEEVAAHAAAVAARAAEVRARAVGGLLEDYSAVSVAAQLGVSRQKVYGNARPLGALRESAVSALRAGLEVVFGPAGHEPAGVQAAAGVGRGGRVARVGGEVHPLDVGPARRWWLGRNAGVVVASREELA